MLKGKIVILEGKRANICIMAIPKGEHRAKEQLELSWRDMKVSRVSRRNWASEMVQGEGHLFATKPSDSSLFLEPHRVERENRFL